MKWVGGRVSNTHVCVCVCVCARVCVCACVRVCVGVYERRARMCMLVIGHGAACAHTRKRVGERAHASAASHLQPIEATSYSRQQPGAINRLAQAQVPAPTHRHDGIGVEGGVRGEVVGLDVVHVYAAARTCVWQGLRLSRVGWLRVRIVEVICWVEEAALARASAHGGPLASFAPVRHKHENPSNPAGPSPPAADGPAVCGSEVLHVAPQVGVVADEARIGLQGVDSKFDGKCVTMVWQVSSSADRGTS